MENRLCPSCGKELPGLARYCPWCGIKIEEPYSEKKQSDEEIKPAGNNESEAPEASAENRGGETRQKEAAVDSMKDHTGTPKTTGKRWLLITLLILAVAAAIAAANQETVSDYGEEITTHEVSETRIVDSEEVPFEKGMAMDDFEKSIAFLMGDTFGSDNISIIRDEELEMIYIDVWQNGQAEVLMKQGEEQSVRDAWKETGDKINLACDVCSLSAETAGLEDWGISVSMVNDENHERALFTSFHGKTVYDVLQ